MGNRHTRRKIPKLPEKVRATVIVSMASAVYFHDVHTEWMAENVNATNRDRRLSFVPPPNWTRDIRPPESYGLVVQLEPRKKINN